MGSTGKQILSLVVACSISYYWGSKRTSNNLPAAQTTPVVDQLSKTENCHQEKVQLAQKISSQLKPNLKIKSYKEPNELHPYNQFLLGSWKNRSDYGDISLDVKKGEKAISISYDFYLPGHFNISGEVTHQNGDSNDIFITLDDNTRFQIYTGESSELLSGMFIFDEANNPEAITEYEPVSFERL